MLRIFRNLALGFLVIFGALVLDAKSVRVRGYTRRDGTYVRSHTRGTPTFSGDYQKIKILSPSGRYTDNSTETPIIDSSKKFYSTRPVWSYYSKSKLRVWSRNSRFKRRSIGVRNHDTRTFSKGMKLKAYYAQGGRCKHCGRYGSINEMEADHIVPYSKGGKTTFSNLQILCRKCNRTKSNRYSR